MTNTLIDGKVTVLNQLPLYIFEEDKNGKEICRNICLIKRARLKDGREIRVAVLSEKVDIEKDPILKEYFESW